MGAILETIGAICQVGDTPLNRLHVHAQLVNLWIGIQPRLVQKARHFRAALVARVAEHVRDTQQQPMLPLLVCHASQLALGLRDRRRVSRGASRTYLEGERRAGQRNVLLAQPHMHPVLASEAD